MKDEETVALIAGGILHLMSDHPVRAVSIPLIHLIRYLCVMVETVSIMERSLV